MKVFVPVPSESILADGEVKGQLVPFHPDYLAHPLSVKEVRKPLDWVEKTDYTSACQSLHPSLSNT
ncbi:MAG TPA: hypothetical protein EYQ22_03450 [Gammaproteobacteria bacterium]|nr:hypothetical protein [Gammaproteobacteria bacterium]HIK70160.1 hypothetical protein [Pseudomonadales bacterium]